MKQAQTITDLNALLINRIVQLERELDAQIITDGVFAGNVKMLLRVYRRERKRVNGYE